VADRMDLIRSSLADRAGSIASAAMRGVVSLRELPVAGQIDLRGDPADARFLDGVKGTIGFGLPVEPNRVTARGDAAALWLSPDQWLVFVPFGDRDRLLTQLRSQLAGQHVSIVDVSANRIALELTGPKAREVLAKGCGLDLHPHAFGPDRCAQSLLARSQALIWQIDNAPTFRLLVRPSFAGYVADFLVDAMREYALDPIAG
jgi:sarcosine oxidase, subunit gamma